MLTRDSSTDSIGDMPKSDFIQQLFDFSRGRSRLVTTLELRVAGFKESTVLDYVDAGLLTRVVRGLYVIGEAHLTQDELLTASLLFGGRHSWHAGLTSAEVRLVLPCATGTLTSFAWARARTAPSRPRSR